MDETDGNGISLSDVANSATTTTTTTTTTTATATATSPGNIYGDIDRFGRDVNQDWTDGGTTVDDLVYGYDADGNVMTRTDTTSSHSANNSESYVTDGLNRLTGFALGNISTGTITSPVESQSWSLDALGNWASETTGGTAVSRVNNSKNEIASIGGSTMSYDAVGNLTEDDAGYKYIYDPWGRLVKWVVPGGDVDDDHYYVGYSYTAGGKMAATENFSGTGSHDSYYDLSWRVVESGTASVACGGSTVEDATSQYVWGLTYVNDLVERDDNYSTDGGDLTRRLYAVRDANHDVIALTDTSGNVAERFDYTPYGTLSVMNASFGATTDTYDWNVGYQGGVYLQTPGTSTPGTQLIQFDNRVYDTALGRWLQPDPAGYVDGADFYIFASCNPEMLSDPNGLSSNSSFEGTGKATIGNIKLEIGTQPEPNQGADLKDEVSKRLSAQAQIKFTYLPTFGKSHMYGPNVSFCPCTNISWHVWVRIVLPAGTPPADVAQIAQGEAAEHGGQNPVVDSNSSATAGWVGDNEKGDRNLPYGGAQDGSTLEDTPGTPYYRYKEIAWESQNYLDTSGPTWQWRKHPTATHLVPVPYYEGKNINVQKQFLAIPMCWGKPVGVGIMNTVSMNPSSPSNTTVKGEVVSIPGGYGDSK